ncbi:imidazole glycerol phosphate synthase subunit HisH [Photorhabdus laumondii subsp. laumondii]|uniref:Imidazole glycerol phosphate synthase subunit HisH n=2 Tax=Photorhabdus laumondii subsp. laumondii TaxID=141679 RepID=HIS5_PHOLL|nr:MULTISPECIES: imidazole glycerol phosphate synthase subunit HisH [Photorhabdus]Q7N6I3.1 RecName: Full=Imidazole glycerol phosphate synthase subunit HisH; AltName: Full=IGP synthase glutaminase subunit; AltName: Full=IGP synthase subunit HisH; AltName: Full=ImGP synthase subunit HisH; Short=IGPS subunit HisH [Photorhabdus laumondii subsp. laumondii TTO1]AWK41421.1 imidazole glycerol phosphate synthase subunit HisH [Photorhabdus laumondii subsp. laumondii]AXG42151.1 imidazole glycerol phosphate
MKVVILDTGCANLSSVTYAIRKLGYQPEISQETATILAADKLLLPGVGTASAAMDQLKQRELIPLIKVLSQPVLGICLGMQLFAATSEESDNVAGNNVTLLEVMASPVQKMATHGLPLPHMGWNQVLPKAGHPLFRGIEDHAYFYFVHSYAIPLNTYTIAQTEYGNIFSSAIAKDNFFGVQFHPERSGAAGARLLKNFLEM